MAKKIWLPKSILKDSKIQQTFKDESKQYVIKKCLNCGRTFGFPKRQDAQLQNRLFCCDACRNEYYEKHKEGLSKNE